MPVPTKVDVTHYRGDSLAISLQVWRDIAKTQPADFTNATIAAQVRTTVDSPDVAADFDVSHSGNVLTLVLTNKETAALGPTNVWDVEIDWNSDEVSVSTVVAGSLAIAPDVTREITP